MTLAPRRAISHNNVFGGFMGKPQVKIGDVVFVAHPQCKGNGQLICPAVVTQQFHADRDDLDTLCNLTVFVPFMSPQHVGSVTLYANARTHEQVQNDPQFVGCWGRDALSALGQMGATLGAQAA